ncbi:MAG: T9SS type A sorting domain-containing protein [Bacteroidota bacterium]
MRILGTLILLSLLCTTGIAQNDIVPFPSGIPSPLEEEGRSNFRQGNEQLDSIYSYTYNSSSGSWEISRKVIFTYLQSNAGLWVSYKWDSASLSWKFLARNISYYDPLTRESKDTLQSWNTTGRVWENSSANYFKLDRFDQLSDKELSNWQNGTWKGVTRSFTNILIPNREQELVDQRWDDNLNQWEPFSKTNLEYRIPGNFNSRTWFNWDGTAGNWNSYRRTLWNYDAATNTQIQSTVEQNFDASTQIWDSTAISLYAYNSLGQLTEIKTENNNGWHRGWQNYSRNAFGYDGNGNEDSLLWQKWNDTLSRWDNQSKEITEWDQTFDKELDFKSFTWENGWIKRRRSTFQLTPTGNWAEITYFDKEPSRNEWLPQIRYVYYYSKVTSVKASMSQLSCALPNPIQKGYAYTCDALEANTSYTLQVQDISGRVLQKTPFKGSDSFQLTGNFSEGIYLLSIFDGQGWVYQNKVKIE